jgi:hypothetical protein
MGFSIASSWARSAEPSRQAIAHAMVFIGLAGGKGMA